VLRKQFEKAWLFNMLIFSQENGIMTIIFVNHQFDYIYPKEGKLVESFIRGNELTFLSTLVTNYARIAKEQGNGHDMRHSRGYLY
jgi:hypothetical protein